MLASAHLGPLAKGSFNLKFNATDALLHGLELLVKIRQGIKQRKLNRLRLPPSDATVYVADGELAPTWCPAFILNPDRPVPFQERCGEMLAMDTPIVAA